MSYKIIAKYETFQQDLRCRIWEWSVYNGTEEVQCHSVQDLNWFLFQKWSKVYWPSVRRQLPRKCAEKCGWSREKHVRENSTLFQTGTQIVMYNMIHINYESHCWLVLAKCDKVFLLWEIAPQRNCFRLFIIFHLGKLSKCTRTTPLVIQWEGWLLNNIQADKVQ